MRLKREVEMYQWVEETIKDGDELIFKYKKKWVKKQVNSDKFNLPDDYVNHHER